MENFMKSHKTFLHSEKRSCPAFEANQIRLFLHIAAYVLLHSLAHDGLAGTKWVNKQVNTLRNRILEVAGRACELKTRIRFHLPASPPLKHLHAEIPRNRSLAYP